MAEQKEPKQSMLFYTFIIILAILLINAFVIPYVSDNVTEEVDYNTFLDMLEKGEITEAQIDDNYITFTVASDDEKKYRTGTMEDPDLVKRLREANVNFTRNVPQEFSPLLTFLAFWILPIIIIIAIGHYFSKKIPEKSGGGTGPMTFGKSKAKIYAETDVKVTFDDVAGQDEAKEALKEIVDFLHNPAKYSEVGAKMPKGALLVGPPGTGKTLLAKAVAGESKVPFFSISGSEFVEMFVGMGAARVRDLFKQAQEKAPCIVFIDEIDTIGRKRGSSLTTNEEREQTLNQLLHEMDGFDSDKGVVILAATNRPDILDRALLRPGRFDRRIPVELPDLNGRIAILKVHTRKVNLSDNVDLNKIARSMPGASGADLANLVNEAALRAVRRGREVVEQEDFEESIEVVVAGYPRKNAVLSNRDKLRVAYHEVGHAIVAAMTNNSAPVQKISIIPRTSGALGFTMQVEEDQILISKEQALDKITVLTAGRAAEEIIFNTITSGAPMISKKQPKWRVRWSLGTV